MPVFPLDASLMPSIGPGVLQAFQESMDEELGTPRPEGRFLMLVTRTIRAYFSSTKAPTLLLWKLLIIYEGTFLGIR